MPQQRDSSRANISKLKQLLLPEGGTTENQSKISVTPRLELASDLYDDRCRIIRNALREVGTDLGVLTNDGAELMPSWLAQRLDIEDPRYPAIARTIADIAYRQLPIAEAVIEAKSKSEFLSELGSIRARSYLEFTKFVDGSNAFVKSVVEANVVMRPKGFYARHIRPESYARDLFDRLKLKITPDELCNRPIELRDPMRTEHLRDFLAQHPYRQLENSLQDFFFDLCLNLGIEIHRTLKLATDESIVGIADFDELSRTATVSYFVHWFGDEESFSNSRNTRTHVDIKCRRYEIELINASRFDLDSANTREFYVPEFVECIIDSAPWLRPAFTIIDGEQTHQRSEIISDKREIQVKSNQPVYVLDPALTLSDFTLVCWQSWQAKQESRARLVSIRSTLRKTVIADWVKMTLIRPLATGTRVGILAISFVCLLMGSLMTFAAVTNGNVHWMFGAFLVGFAVGGFWLGHLLRRLWRWSGQPDVLGGGS